MWCRVILCIVVLGCDLFFVWCVALCSVDVCCVVFALFWFWCWFVVSCVVCCVVVLLGVA